MDKDEKDVLEKGTVVDKNGTRAYIRVDPASPDACEGCGMCALVESGNRVREVEAGDLQPGDRVILRPRRCSSYTSMLLLLVTPIVFFMVGLGTGSWLWPGSDLLPALLGAAGLGVGFVVPWLVEKRIEGRQRVEVRRADEPRPAAHETGHEPAIARCCDAAPTYRNRS